MRLRLRVTNFGLGLCGLCIGLIGVMLGLRITGCCDVFLLRVSGPRWLMMRALCRIVFCYW